ncbi:MAG: 30S ribosomal protein S6 [Actinobacteria bacterium]|nr:30S ribosomal protein S6 [Actinomycetota bacterium]
MRAYEVVVIFDATLEEEAIRPVLDRATAPITKDGTKATTDRWGKRRFAYELKKRWEGNYVLLAFNSEPGPVAELDRVLYLADEVLRHKVMRIPEKVAGRQRPTRPAETPPAEAAPATTGAPAGVATGAES